MRIHLSECVSVCQVEACYRCGNTFKTLSYHHHTFHDITVCMAASEIVQHFSPSQIWLVHFRRMNGDLRWKQSQQLFTRAIARLNRDLNLFNNLSYYEKWKHLPCHHHALGRFRYRPAFQPQPWFSCFLCWIFMYTLYYHPTVVWIESGMGCLLFSVNSGLSKNWNAEVAVSILWVNA